MDLRAERVDVHPRPRAARRARASSHRSRCWTPTPGPPASPRTTTDRLRSPGAPTTRSWLPPAPTPTPPTRSIECRAAARVLSAGYDYERAAELMDSAVELAERLTPPHEHVDVLLEWADALQVCGRLADARAAYERAVAAAESAADTEARARAALGLGGVWVDEHRGQADRQRVLALQRSARAALPPDAVTLRARLDVRLAAEAVYDSAPVEPVFDALAVARAARRPARPRRGAVAQPPRAAGAGAPLPIGCRSPTS